MKTILSSSIPEGAVLVPTPVGCLAWVRERARSCEWRLELPHNTAYGEVDDRRSAEEIIQILLGHADGASGRGSH